MWGVNTMSTDKSTLEAGENSTSGADAAGTAAAEPPTGAADTKSQSTTGTAPAAPSGAQRARGRLPVEVPMRRQPKRKATKRRRLRSGGDGSEGSGGESDEADDVDGRTGHRRKDVAVEDLKRHFDKPLREVAARYDMCVTLLKKICRRHGVFKWPYRQIRSYSRLIQDLEQARSSALHDPESLAALDEQLQELRDKRAELFTVPQDPKALPQGPGPAHTMPRLGRALHLLPPARSAAAPADRDEELLRAARTKAHADAAAVAAHRVASAQQLAAAQYASMLAAQHPQSLSAMMAMSGSTVLPTAVPHPYSAAFMGAAGLYGHPAGGASGLYMAHPGAGDAFRMAIPGLNPMGGDPSLAAYVMPTAMPTAPPTSLAGVSGAATAFPSHHFPASAGYGGGAFSGGAVWAPGGQGAGPARGAYGATAHSGPAVSVGQSSLGRALSDSTYSNTAESKAGPDRVRDLLPMPVDPAAELSKSMPASRLSQDAPGSRSGAFPTPLGVASLSYGTTAPDSTELRPGSVAGIAARGGGGAAPPSSSKSAGAAGVADQQMAGTTGTQLS